MELGFWTAPFWAQTVYFLMCLIAGIVSMWTLCSDYDYEFETSRIDMKSRIILTAGTAVLSIMLLFLQLWPVYLILLFVIAIVQRTWTVHRLKQLDQTVQSQPATTTPDPRIASAAIIVKALWYATGVFGAAAVASVGGWADWIHTAWGNKALGAPTLAVLTVVGILCAYYSSAYTYYGMLQKDDDAKRRRLITFAISIVITIAAMYYFIFSAMVMK